jgi:hypothetical protein
MTKGNIFAKVSGKPSSVKKMLLNWLSDSMVTIEDDRG